MRAARWCPALLLSCVLAACASVDVTYDFDPEEDFSVFRTWDWLPEMELEQQNPDVRVDNPVVHSRLNDAIERTLAEKGFEHTDVDPDIWVAYHLSVEQKQNVIYYNRFYETTGWVTTAPQRQVLEYEQGTLVIDVADAKEKELVWRGIGTAEMLPGPRPKEMTRRADQAVAEILANFPPPRKE